MIESSVPDVLMHLAPGMPCVVAGQQYRGEGDGGGVNVARRQNPVSRRFHRGQFQIERARLLFGARQTGKLKILVRTLEWQHHGLARVFEQWSRGKRGWRTGRRWLV